MEQINLVKYCTSKRNVEQLMCVAFTCLVKDIFSNKKYNLAYDVVNIRSVCPMMHHDVINNLEKREKRLPHFNHIAVLSPLSTLCDIHLLKLLIFCLYCSAQHYHLKKGFDISRFVQNG